MGESTGIQRKLISSSKNTWDGIKTLWANEQSFRWEVYVGIVLLPIIFLLDASSQLKLILLLLMLLLLVVETINSAIEVMVDRISLEPHVQSKAAKDMGSAAVGMVILMNTVAWIYALYLQFMT